MTRRRRWWLAPLAVVLALVIVGLGALSWLLATESGTRRSLAMLQRAAPGLQTRDVRGSWRRGLAIGEVRYRTDGLAIQITDLELAIRVQPALRRMTVDRLTAAAIIVEQLPSNIEESERDEPLALAQIDLPASIQMPRIAIDQLTYRQADTELVFTSLRGGLSLSGNEVEWREVAGHWDERQLQTAGRLRLKGNYPLTAAARWRDPALPGELSLDAEGDLSQLGLKAELAGDVAIRAQAQIDVLDPELPLTATAQLLSTLEAGGIVITSAAAELSGTPDALDGAVTATVEGVPGYDRAELGGPFKLRGNILSAAPQFRLGAEASQGTAELDCELSTAAPFPLACTGALDQVSLAPWLGSGSINSPVRFAATSWVPLALNAELSHLSGTVHDGDVSGRLSIASREKHWHIENTALVIAGNRLTADGRIGPASELTLDLDANQLDQLRPGLKGSVQLQAALNGSLQAPSISLTGRAASLKLGEMALGSARIEAQIAELGRQPSTLLIEFDKLLAAASIASGRLVIDGTRSSHRVNLRAAGIADLAETELACTGLAADDFERWQLSCERWLTRLDRPSQPWEWRLDNMLRLEWQREPQRLALQPFCLASDEGRLCLERPAAWAAGSLSRLLVRGSSLPLDRLLAFDPALYLGSRPIADVTLDLASLDPLQLTAAVDISGSTWEWETLDGPEQGRIDATSIRFEANDQRAVLRATTGGPALGSLQADLEVGDPQGERGLTGQLQLEGLRLADFGWIAPELQWQGEIGAAVTLAGTVAAPRLTGSARLRGGRVQPSATGQPVEDIALDVGFDEHQAQFDGVFSLAPGRGQVSGVLDLPTADEPWKLALELSGNQLQIEPLPRSYVRFSPDLTLKAGPDDIALTGQIRVQEADIQLKSLPPDTADVSPDAEWVGEEEVAAEPMEVNADIAVALGNQVHFEGFGADIWLRGNLRLRHSPRLSMRLAGQVQVPSGRYRAYGQRLVVRRGTLLFTGPPGNPELNLEAIREMPPTVHDQVVGLRVTGPLRNPSGQLFAEPSMPESDIAYFLLTGRARPASGATGEISAAGALLSLGAAGTGDHTQRFAERFGISDFEISTYESETGTQAAVSGYLTPRLYVRYGTGLRDRVNSITFQYQLTPSLILEAISGAEEALDLLYSFTID